MDLKTYIEQKKQREKQKPVYRGVCVQCRQPDFSCYCAQLKPINTQISFVILIHHLEAKRRVATGRMAYLSLKDSHIVRGDDYTENKTVNALIAEEGYASYVLYPGKDAFGLDKASSDEIKAMCPENKKLRVFVIDGTWATARHTYNRSKNLQKLPKIAFTPEKPSAFKVRKQPQEHCYSTIEAIHQTIEICGNNFGFDVQGREHDHMLSVFAGLVQQQIDLSDEAYAKSGQAGCYRRVRRSV